MRACSIANAIASGFGMAALIFSSCRNGATVLEPSTSTISPPAAANFDASDNDARFDADNDRSPAKSKNTFSCTLNLSAPPDRGVVFTNAEVPDKGEKDRLAPALSILHANQQLLTNCCSEGKSPPGDSQRMTLILKLRPDGNIEDVHLRNLKSSADNGEMTSCIARELRALTFPASPQGKTTVFSQELSFKSESNTGSESPSHPDSGG